MKESCFYPTPLLSQFIQCYWLYTSGKESIAQTIFPSGHLELAINISGGSLITTLKGNSTSLPPIEVLGHLTGPGLIVAENVTLLVARFYAHASSVFFSAPASCFTNHSIDLTELFKDEASQLSTEIGNVHTIEQKIAVLENFLLQKIRSKELSQKNILLIKNICTDVVNEAGMTNVKKIASKYGFTERKIQKLFLEYVGLTPKMFFKTLRFNKSLQFLQAVDLSLTSIAYECGYYDQSHFIREFSEFSGLIPSQVRRASLPIL